jgi:acetyl-CoA carboxylase biotin carboxyl carrier protein
MNIDEIRELIYLVKETGVAELEVQRAENRVRIRLAVAAAAAPELVTAAAAPPAAAAPSGGKPVAQKTSAPEAPPAENELLVKAPIVGTFYEASAPGAPPFVKLGDSVQPGKVLCIIESMKLMNEIEAEVAGVVVSKLVQNGQPVEYGEALFAIRPL